MKRREFTALLGSATVARPLAARAQKAPACIGLLFAGSADSPGTKARLAALEEGWRGNGLMAGRDYVLEMRFASGHYERFSALAGELAQAGARMILCNTIASVRAAQSLVPPLPVVMMAINDPVGTGLVASLARPGGRTTGMASMAGDVMPKMLEFQRTILSDTKIIGVLFNPLNPSNQSMVDTVKARASAMGMTVNAAPCRWPEELDAALGALASAKPDALHLAPDSASLDLVDRIAAFAIARQLPFFVPWPEVVDFGGLLGYGASERKLLVRSGYYVKRLLDGADPADLPVEQPTGIELRLNLKTARRLGITIPPLLLASVDDVIE